MLAPDQRVGASFEVHGHWWIPGAEEHAPKSGGTLRFSPEEGARLSILDWYRGFTEPAEAPVIFGRTHHGKNCTLLDAFPHRFNMAIGGGVHTNSTWQSNAFYLGAHIRSADELEVREVEVQMLGLLEWLSQPWARDSDQLLGLGGTTHGAEHACRQSLNVPVPGGALELEVGPVRHRTPQETTYRLAARAEVLLDQSQPWPAVREQFVGPLQDLVTFCHRQDAPVTAMTVYSYPGEPAEEPLERARQLDRSKVQVVERTSLHYDLERKRSYQRMVMPLAALEEKAVEAVASWFELRASLDVAGSVLSGVLSDRFMVLENQLLNLMAFAEGYHRKLHDNPQVERHRHRQIVKAMLGTLENTNEKQIYRQRLGHAYEQTQRVRVVALCESAATYLPPAQDWLELMPRQLVETRNHLTHLSEPSPHVLEGQNLIVAVKRFTAVVQLNLLLDLGIDGAVAGEMVRRGYQVDRIW